MPPEDNPLEFLTGLQASVLFRALPEILDAHAWMFIVAAFLLLAGGFAWRMYEAGNNGRATMNVWYRMLLVLTFMLLSPKLCLWGYEAVDSVVADGGGRTPNSVTRKCIKLALSTPELESVLSKYSRSVQYPTLPSSGDVRRAVEEEGLWGYAKAFWYTLGEEVSGIRSEGSDKTGVLTEGPVLVASMAAGLTHASRADEGCLHSDSAADG